MFIVSMRFIDKMAAFGGQRKIVLQKLLGGGEKRRIRSCRERRKSARNSKRRRAHDCQIGFAAEAEVADVDGTEELVGARD